MVDTVFSKGLLSYKLKIESERKTLEDFQYSALVSLIF